MIYLKSVLVGLGAVLVAGILGLLIVFYVLPSHSGAGSIGVVFGTATFLAVLGIPLLIFALGFFWQFRRASRRP